jgi:hypothetical protein
MRARDGGGGGGGVVAPQGTLDVTRWALGCPQLWTPLARQEEDSKQAFPEALPRTGLSGHSGRQVTRGSHDNAEDGLTSDLLPVFAAVLLAQDGPGDPCSE